MHCRRRRVVKLKMTENHGMQGSLHSIWGGQRRRDEWGQRKCTYVHQVIASTHLLLEKNMWPGLASVKAMLRQERGKRVPWKEMEAPQVKAPS